MGGHPPPRLTLVSACLVGIACRYDGQSCPQPTLQAQCARGCLLPVCPEVVGGLSIPRPPAEIERAAAGLDGAAVLDGRTRVILRDGRDVTAAFLAGARWTLSIAHRWDIRQAILKAGSPSCGVGAIYSGCFSGEVVPGDGVTAALLRRAGLSVATEEVWCGGE